MHQCLALPPFDLAFSSVYGDRVHPLSLLPNERTLNDEGFLDLFGSVCVLWRPSFDYQEVGVDFSFNRRHFCLCFRKKGGFPRTRRTSVANNRRSHLARDFLGWGG